jgi:phosphonate degradation associated HDIG domain protein
MNIKLALSRAAELRAELDEIYEVRAHGQYGLSQINQLMHAVQSASLAQSRGCAPALVVAALLHDVGHMVHDLGEHPAAEGVDDMHELVAAKWLERYFGAEVVEPVRLHVAAKRYLCAVEPTYTGHLSRDSVESLALQGGPMSKEEVQTFERQPYWRDAVTLRRIDDDAKDPRGAFPALSSFWPAIEQVLLED